MAASSIQLWALDSDGAVYVLQDAGAWLSSVRSNQVLHKNAATVHDNWTGGVDGRFDRVICGARGLVCAQKDKVLYVRRGVTYDNPLGTAWAKALCDARELAVGSNCLVRRTTQDHLFVTDSVDLSTTSSVFLPHWNSIPTCTDLNTHWLFTVDANDNLFIVSPSSGDVFVCKNLSSVPSDDFHWSKLIGGPPTVKNQSLIFSNILRWASSNGGSNGNVITSICAGDGCLWCVGASGREIYQLVLKYFVKKAKKRKSEGDVKRTSEIVSIEGTWKKFDLPGKDQVTLLAADWTELAGLCAVVRENRTVVSYALLQENSGRVEIPNPSGTSHRWRSLAVCAVPKPSLSLTGSNTPKKIYSSIYPKLPLREDHDICCENGECSFCRRAEEEATANWTLSGAENLSSSSMERREELVTGRKSEPCIGEEAGPPGAKRIKFLVPTEEEEEESAFRVGRKRKSLKLEEAYPAKRLRIPNSEQQLVVDIPCKLSRSAAQRERIQNLLKHQVHCCTIDSWSSII